MPIPASLLADIDAALDRVDDWDAIERALSDPADAAQQRTPSALLSVLVHNPPLDSELPRVAHLAVLQDEVRHARSLRQKVHRRAARAAKTTHHGHVDPAGPPDQARVGSSLAHPGGRE